MPTNLAAPDQPPATPDAPAAAAGDPPASAAPGASPADSPPATPDVPAAASSPAPGVDDGKEALLAVTRAALAPPADGPAGQPATPAGTPSAPSADAGTPAPASTPPASAAPSEAPAPTEDKDDTFGDADTLPFGKHARFRRLLQQWNRDKEPAARHRQLEGFLLEHGVPAPAAADALKLAAILQQAQRGSVEHAKLFLKEMLPQVTKLRQLVGEEIAPELQPKLEAGALDEDSARALTAAQAKAEAAQRAVDEQAEARQAEQARQVKAQAAQAVSEWEARTRVLDPDFDRKASLIPAVAANLAARDGYPRNAADAVALTQRAYEQVSKQFEGLSAAPPPSPPPPPPRPNNGAPPRNMSPQLTTPVDVTRAALGLL